MCKELAAAMCYKPLDGRFVPRVLGLPRGLRSARLGSRLAPPTRSAPHGAELFPASPRGRFHGLLNVLLNVFKGEGSTTQGAHKLKPLTRLQRQP
jgi:hypothetical protein